MALLGEAMTADYKSGQKFKECFTPLPSQQRVYDAIEGSKVAASKWLHVLMFGDTGGAKTWTAIGYAIKCMLQGPGCRVLCIRETKGDLMMTTYGEVKRFFETWDIEIVEENKTYGYIRIANGSEIHFRSDKSLTKNNKDKSDSLGSSEFSIVIFEEADSISRETYETMSGRMRQQVHGIRKVIFAICNPPRKGHWLFRKYNFEDRQKPPLHLRRWLIFHMLAKENHHLGKGYDEAKNEDWADNPAFQRRMGLGLQGPETKGIPYFRAHFSRNRHVTSRDLRKAADPYNPIWRGWDFGYNHPACVVLQDDQQRGQVRVLFSIVAQEMSTREFVLYSKRIIDAGFMDAGVDPHRFTYKDAADAAGIVTGKQ